MIGEEARSLTRRLLRRDNRGGIGQRMQLRQSILAGRRHGQSDDDRDNAIEL
jgi:hypothetical protein